MNHNLTPAEIEVYKDVFKRFQDDGEKITISKELCNQLKSVGSSATEAVLEDLINEVFTNVNIVMDLDEFLSLIASKTAAKDTEKQIRDAFNAFDQDGNGFISAIEFRNGMSILGEKLTEEEVSDMIHDVDVDNDGQINYEEFVVLMTKK